MVPSPGPTPTRTQAARAVAAAIRAYAPASLSPAAAAFARTAAARAAPQTRERAKALLYAASRLAAFGESAGMELRAEALLSEATIERFILTGCPTASAATRRTLRTNLRALARAHESPPRPEPTPLARERAKAPYSEAEVEGYLRLAAAQPGEARRMRATALICLGAGAGLVGAELRHLRGRDVQRRSGGLVVAVSGRRARAAPVLARFHRPLEAAAAFAGRGYLLGGESSGRRNLTDVLGAALSADAGLPRLEAGRLRSTWLCECAELIGLRAFMEAAGLRCSQRLGDLVAELPTVAEAEAVALLGGSGEGRSEATAP
jgi:integrase